MATTRSATTKSAKTKSAKTKSAKAKYAKAKSAARSVALKKSTQRKKAAVSTSRTKAKPGKPLSDCQKRRNTRIAKPRARVEHVFAALHHMGGKGVRTIGLARANLQLHLKAAAYNLRRLCSLIEGGVPAF